jgi:hypothetical protein
LTFSASTAYCSTESRLRSECSARFATFRCTNISPGWAPVSSSAGTRLSLHPMKRNVGCCPAALRPK